MIPFNKPHVSSMGLKHMNRSLEGEHHAGDGPLSNQCSDYLSGLFGGRSVLLTPSCTDSLELCSLLLDLKEGDEVIIPSYAFVSCANAFVLRGARPIFCDSRPDTVNLDESKLEALISPKTKVIVLIHYAGLACELDEIMAVARKYNIMVVEDYAHGPFSTYHGQNVGTFGHLATLSFHQTKNYSCGEGGALVINDPKLVERAEIIREKGTDRSRFFRGQVDKYTWRDLGSSYLMADYQAGLLLGALEEHDWIQERRHRIWNRYFNELMNWAEELKIQLPPVVQSVEHSAHLFFMVMPEPEMQEQFINHMKDHGVQCTFHYQALHQTPKGKEYGVFQKDPCQHAIRLSRCLVRLPIWADLTEDQVDQVITSVIAYTGKL